MEMQPSTNKIHLIQRKLLVNEETAEEVAKILLREQFMQSLTKATEVDNKLSEKRIKRN